MSVHQPSIPVPMSDDVKGETVAVDVNITLDHPISYSLHFLQFIENDLQYSCR